MSGPVLAWEPNSGPGSRVNAGPVRATVEPGRFGAAGWVAYVDGQRNVIIHDAPTEAAAQLAAESWLREQLAPLAALWRDDDA